MTMKKMVIFLLTFFPVAGSFCQKKIIVAMDGSGDYRTVQAALDAVPEVNNKTVTIHIKKGIYKEVVVVDARKSFITLIGEDPKNTILTFDNHAGTKLPNGDTLNTCTSASFFIY